MGASVQAAEQAALVGRHRIHEVCIAGITAGNDNNANARLTTSIKAFWEELIQASGGRLVGYGTTPRVCPFL